MLGSTIGQAAGSLGLGMLLGNWEDKRQLEQQQKLQEQQIKGAKKMGQFNYDMAMRMWQETNYAAQVEQMRKAGLNVGLMYKAGGPGGTTATPTGQITGATAQQKGAEHMGMGMQLALQTATQQAQIELAQAQARKTNVEADKLGGTDTTESKGRIAKLAEETNNLKLQNDLMKIDKQIKSNEETVSTATTDKQIEIINETYNKLKAEADTAINNAEISQATKEQQKLAVTKALEEQQIRMTLIAAGILQAGADIAQSQAQIAKISAEIQDIYRARMQHGQQLTQKDKEIAIQDARLRLEEIMQQFKTATPEQIRQWTQILPQLMVIPK